MIYVLRLVHIISGVFWVGSIMFATLMLAPSLKAVGPAAGPVMNQVFKVRKMPIVMMVSAFLTIGAGVWLMIIVSAGQMGAWMRSGPGRTFAMGAMSAIIGLVIGLAVNVPASKRLAALGSAAEVRGGPPTPDEQAEMRRLQARMATASMIVMVLLLIATGAMAIARYVP